MPLNNDIHLTTTFTCQQTASESAARPARAARPSWKGGIVYVFMWSPCDIVGPPLLFILALDKTLVHECKIGVREQVSDAQGAA